MIHRRSILGLALVAALLPAAACVSQSFIMKERATEEYTLSTQRNTIVSAFRIVATLPGPDRMRAVWGGKTELEDAAKAAAARIQDDFDHNRIGSWCFSYHPKKGTCHSDNLIVEYEIPYFPRVWNNRATRIVEPIKAAWDRPVSIAAHGMAAPMMKSVSSTPQPPPPPPETQPHADGEICTQEYQYLTGLDGQTSWILWGKLCIPSCEDAAARCRWIQLDSGVFPP